MLMFDTIILSKIMMLETVKLSKKCLCCHLVIILFNGIHIEQSFDFPNSVISRVSTFLHIHSFQDYKKHYKMQSNTTRQKYVSHTFLQLFLFMNIQHKYDNAKKGAVQ